jgi:hypothetical protein
VNHIQVAERFGRADRFTREDLNELRASMPAVILGAKSDLHSHTRELRMDIELLEVLTELREAIEHMSASSTALVKTTNRLTAIMLLFTVVAAAAGVIGLMR